MTELLPADTASQPPQDYRAILASRRARGQASKWAPINIGIKPPRNDAAPMA